MAIETIASGVFNGVNWESMSPSPKQIYTNHLEARLKSFNRIRKIDNLKQLGHAEFIKLKYQMTVYQYFNKPFSRVKYYTRTAYYNNNFGL